VREERPKLLPGRPPKLLTGIRRGLENNE